MPRRNRKRGAAMEFGGGRLLALEQELHARQRARWERAGGDPDPQPRGLAGHRERHDQGEDE